MSLLIRRIFKLLSSLELTIICLVLVMMLIFSATLDQVHLGLYGMQKKYFEGWLVWWPLRSGRLIPVFPSGLFLSGVLLLNLVCAHTVRFRFQVCKMGIWLVHLGLIVLLVGAGLTHFLSTESQMPITVSGHAVYSEDANEMELAIIKQGKETDQIWSIPKARLVAGKILTDSLLPFPIMVPENFEQQAKSWKVKDYELVMRPRRYYNDYSVTLQSFTHKQYMGTTIPKEFSSRVHIQDFKTGEVRDAVISMNQPLRFRGKTFYQASFAQGDTVSILQVVENPSWIFPYVASIMMALGLLYQFAWHLLRYLKRRPAA
ncbi:MAG: hypothetical protein EXS67_03620 [Candidatus Margulisbacteria bacterium]|nr:hypothetical protein [Candidatus Margulisiibacteriota bacterium]